MALFLKSKPDGGFITRVTLDTTPLYVAPNLPRGPIVSHPGDTSDVILHTKKMNVSSAEYGIHSATTAGSMYK